MAKTPKTRLTWFLLKPSVNLANAKSIIENPDSLHRYKVPALHAQHETLFVKTSPPKTPSWVGYLKPHLGSGQLPGIRGSAASGALLIPVRTRVLVVTFGYGRFLIRTDAVVQDFGLRVVLNTVEHLQLKSVDARSFDELTVHTRRGLSRDSALPEFELDVSRNILRGLTGTSQDAEIPGTLSGTDSLAFTSTTRLPDLPALAEKLFAAYGAKRYLQHFEFIDQLRAERGKAMVEKLNGRLTKALLDGDLDDLHLAIPEAVDWQKIAGVRFSYRRRHHELEPDPKISVYRGLRSGDGMTVDRLKSDKVEAVDAADESVLAGHWPVYDCVVFETEYSGKLYVLSGGDWYCVKKSYRDKVEAYVKALPVLAKGLPPARVGQSEGDYNVSAAKVVGALNVDKALIGVGGRDRVELCDLLTQDGFFIHVKKRGRSSTLSHLFSQGVTSTELLLQDAEFLRAASRLVTKLDKSFAASVPTQPGARDQIKVGYVVLSRSRRTTPFGLPFFSLVSLQAAAQRLRAAGVDVFVQEIKEA